MMLNSCCTQALKQFMQAGSVNNENFFGAQGPSKSSSNYAAPGVVPCWVALQNALNQLLPEREGTSVSSAAALGSDEYLKLYTLVFDYCVGNQPTTSDKKASVFMLGEDLYVALDSFLKNRFLQWLNDVQLIGEDGVFEACLNQMDCLQAAEKPLTFIFTYLERHWIERQIQEHRVDVSPIKQLIWSRWDQFVLSQLWPNRLSRPISKIIDASRAGVIPLDDLKDLTRFLHYLKVISRPGLVDSDFLSRRKAVNSVSANNNSSAPHCDRFHEFCDWYCEMGLKSAIASIFNGSGASSAEFIQTALQFWNDEEGRMAVLRFDRPAQISLRNCMKEALLVPNMESIKSTFKDTILHWNVLEANRIYRLLANRRSLLAVLDPLAQEAFILKGREYCASVLSDDVYDSSKGIQFIALIGQFSALTSKLIVTALASRSEIFEARNRALKTILNASTPAIKGFAARSLAQYVDSFLVDFNVEDGVAEETFEIIINSLRLLNDREEFHDVFHKLLGVRLLSSTCGSRTTELINRFKEVCGPNFVAPFERMLSDCAEPSGTMSSRILTCGTWNIKGKLFPDHAVFTQIPGNTFPWPDSKLISAQESCYAQRHPKRKLYWIPVLSWVEFNYHPKNEVAGGRGILIRASCLQLEILKILSEGPRSLEEISAAILAGASASASEKKSALPDRMFNALLEVGLILKCDQPALVFSLNADFGADQGPGVLLNLYEAFLMDLNFFNANALGSNRSTVVTPHPSQTPGATSRFTPSRIHSNNNSVVSKADRSVLLQCVMMRLLKQLRTLSLPDLYNRLSMLPVLLTRFSPAMEDVLEALKQLHSKDFVALAFCDGVEQDVQEIFMDLNDQELANLQQDHEGLVVRYLA